MVDLANHSASGTALGAGLAAAFDWWREAGVDCDFRDDPRDWLPAPAAPAVAADAPALAALHAPQRPPLPTAPAVGGDPAGWPQRLEDFSGWWLSEPSLDHGIVMERIAPRGSAGAALMVLVDHPEAEDRERLLAGPQGKLLDAFLLAAGIAAEQVYLASALPRHTPLPDWSALGMAGLGAVTAHHVALAAPQRLLVLGAHISPLLGHDPANSAESLRGFNHEGRNIPVLVAPGLDDMIARPRRKAVLWQHWLEWTGRNS